MNDPTGAIVVIVCALLLVGGIRFWLRQRRSDKLLAKYGDSLLVSRIMRRQVCEGMTEEQVVESIGRPIDVDRRVLKTKQSETWKYQRTGKNRYRLRILMENGRVVGWDKKS